MKNLIPFVSGAIAFGSWVAGIYFLKFWKSTQDRFFLIFAFAFWTLGIERLILAFVIEVENENRYYIYLIRLTAFILILVAIIDKNRKPKLSKQ